MKSKSLNQDQELKIVYSELYVFVLANVILIDLTEVKSICLFGQLE